MMESVLPEGLQAKQKFAIILGGISLVLLGIGVFLLKAGDFETKVKISEQTDATASGITGVIWIDIEGEVKAPGVYKMNRGARVEDAIIAAGGLAEMADVNWVEKNVNRAQIVNDGYKLYIPELSSEKSELQIVENNNQISVNEATQAQLEALSGIGPSTAKKIISGRPYSSLEELIEKKIIGPKLWEKIKRQIVLW